MKRNDDTRIHPSPASFAELDALYAETPSGMGVCCVDDFTAAVTYPEPVFVDRYPYAGHCDVGGILTKGGFFTPFHEDEGATSRCSQLVNRGCAKLWIFINSLTLKDEMKQWKAQWKVFSSFTFPSFLSPSLHPPHFSPPSSPTHRKVSDDSIAIDIADQLSFILKESWHFNFVLQLPGQQMEHSGLYDHAVITLIDPVVNPNLYCLSVGHIIYNGNAMKVSSAPIPLPLLTIYPSLPHFHDP